MKKVLSILIAVTAIVLVSCGGGTTSPRVFNETLVKAYDKVGKTYGDFDAKVTKGVKSKDLASIAVAADSALAIFDAEIGNVEAMNAPKGGEAYKSAMIEMFKSIKEVAEVGKKFSALKEDYTKKEFDALEKEHADKMKEYSKKFAEVGKTQTEFAKAVGAKMR